MDETAPGRPSRPARPPKVKQHTSPEGQLALPEHERSAPIWHCPIAVHEAVVPPGASCAQQTWVAELQVDPPQAMVPPLEPLEPVVPLEDPELPLLEAEPLLDVEPELLLPLDVEPPLDEELAPPLPELPTPLLPEVDEPLPELAPSSAASSPKPGMRGSSPSSRGPRAPHATRTRAAAKVESGLIGFIRSPLGEQSSPARRALCASVPRRLIVAPGRCAASRVFGVSCGVCSFAHLSARPFARGSQVVTRRDSISAAGPLATTRPASIRTTWLARRATSSSAWLTKSAGMATSSRRRSR